MLQCPSGRGGLTRGCLTGEEVSADGGGVCPGGYLTRGVSDKGVSGWGCLTRGVSDKGVSTRGGLPRGVCPGVSVTVHAGIHPCGQNS